MPETCENSLSLVNSCIYYAYQTSEIYQVLPYSVDFKVRVELWNPMSKTVLSKRSFIWKKELRMSEMTIKLKSNLHVGPLNIFCSVYIYIKDPIQSFWW